MGAHPIAQPTARVLEPVAWECSLLIRSSCCSSSSRSVRRSPESDQGCRLGPAAALFAGLAVSAINPDLADLPAIIPLFGLALFIYTIGLASGPAFFGGLRQDGVRVSIAVVVLLAAIGLTVGGVSALFDFDAGARAGLFAGSQTNTPALSAALGQLGTQIVTGEVTDPVVGYSLAYPLGVVAMIIASGWSLRRVRHPGRHADTVAGYRRLLVSAMPRAPR